MVEHPDGDLLVTWFHGSGERTADDVEVLGAWQRKGTTTLDGAGQAGRHARIPGHESHPVRGPHRRLWLLWPTILANEWHTALMKVKIARAWPVGEVPHWDTSEVMHITPGDRFAEVTRREADRLAAALPEGEPGRGRAAYLEKLKTDAADKLTRRLGWMTRVHPLQLEDGRIIVPLYSDGFSFSLMAISDDGGATWKASDPLVGGGNIQPALARRRDGTHRRVHARQRPCSQARARERVARPRRDVDDGERTGRCPIPARASTSLVLQSGRWALVYNDLERGRQSLAISLSRDEGRTWPCHAASRARPGLGDRRRHRAVPLPVDHPVGGRDAPRHLQHLPADRRRARRTRRGGRSASRSSTRISTKRGSWKLPAPSLRLHRGSF